MTTEEIFAEIDKLAHGPSSPKPYNESIPAPEARWLYETVKRANPRQVIEVGMAGGVSTVAICAALQEIEKKRGPTDPIPARCFSVDPFQITAYQSAGSLLVGKLGLSARSFLITEPSQKVLPGLESSGMVFDLAFIDGCHRYEASFVDAFYCDLMLRPGCLMILDDFQYPSIQSVVKHLARNMKYCFLADVPDRFACLRKTTAVRDINDTSEMSGGTSAAAGA